MPSFQGKPSYQLFQIRTQIRCNTFLGSILAVYGSESETYQYLPGHRPCHGSWCVWTTARRAASRKNFISSDRWLNHRQMPWHEHFCKHTFLNDYHPGWQLARKWSIPSCRALIWHPTCCLWTHALRCSLNSTAFQAKSAQPVDPPLWDESAAREGIWGGQIVRLVRCFSSNKYGDYV